MHLHFEDWSKPMFLSQLDQVGLPHDGRIIKVMSSVDNPAEGLDKPELTVVTADGSSFTPTEAYEYNDRGIYAGAQLEEDLLEFGLGDRGNYAVRSLFRFANQHGFCQAAMSAKTDTGWLVDHPFGDIDGIANAQRQPEREKGIHLDIFFPRSVSVIRSIVDIDNPATMLTMREGLAWRQKQD